MAVNRISAKPGGKRAGNLARGEGILLGASLMLVVMMFITAMSCDVQRRAECRRSAAIVDAAGQHELAQQVRRNVCDENAATGGRVRGR